jgi:HlyD family type I secretion membrane fusion protein
VVESHQKTIQHLSGGVIQDILVKEGDQVKENQVLIKMVSTTSDAQVGILKHQAEQLNTKLRSVKPLVTEGYFPKLEYLDLQRQAQEAGLRLKVAQEELERTEVRAPMAGSVMGLSAVTVGGVVAPGGRLMSVIPEGDALVVEVVVPPHLIDKMVKGLEADIRFSALNQRTTPVVQGQVVWVSADRFTNPNAPNPTEGYFTARVSLNPDAMAKIGHQDLKAGMPVDVIIKTGSRTFMSYLLKPFFDRAALSLKEI